MSRPTRAQALELRCRAVKAKATSEAADVALAKAGEAAKVAKEAAKEAEEAAHEAESVVLYSPGGLHGEPSPLVAEVLSGSHGGDVPDCIARACSSVLDPKWLVSLATSCKHGRAGFDAELHSLREKRRAVLAMLRKVGQPITEFSECSLLDWDHKGLTDADMLAINSMAAVGRCGHFAASISRATQLLTQA